MYLIAGGQCGAEDDVENNASKEEAVVAVHMKFMNCTDLFDCAKL